MRKLKKGRKTALAHVGEIWRVREGSALIEVYSPTLQGWSVAAEGRNCPELKAEKVASLLVNAVNGAGQRERMVDSLVEAVELCLECGGLTWAAEQAADVALKRARAR